MPSRDAAALGAPCWIDLTTSDVERSRSFYTEVFGWEADAPSEEFGGYFMFTRDGVPVAGGVPADAEAPVTDIWSVYLATDDAQKTVDAAVSEGAQVIVHPMTVADLGTMAFLVDPGGAAIGLWQPDTFPGLTVVGEPGAPSWFELHTRAYDQSLAFYRNVLRWDTAPLSDTAEFRYSTLRHGDDMLAGVLDADAMLPPGAPSAWSVYIGTADTDATLARAVSLGASVLQPAEDTPYGRLATLADPNGAVFKLVAGG